MAVISTNTNISGEVHRGCFVNQWIASMASIKEEFICMPRDMEEFNSVVGELYTAMGLPGCVGSVDCLCTHWMGHVSNTTTENAQER